MAAFGEVTMLTEAILFQLVTLPNLHVNELKVH